MAAEAAAQTPETPAPLPRRFWTYFSAATISWLGDGMLVVGLPLLAAALTRSPLWIASMVGVQRLAPLLFSLPAGALVDRLDARRVAISVNIAQAVVMGLAGLLLAAGHFPLAALFALAFLTESLAAVFTCASGALVADVVTGPSQFGPANTRLRAANIVAAYVAGPGLGGLVFATGRQLPVLIDAASFVLAAGVLATLRLPAREPKPAAARRHLLTEIKEGMRISFGRPALRLIALILGVLAGFQAGSVAVIVLLGTTDLGLGKTAFGVALACGNIVAPAVILFLPRIQRMTASSVVLMSLAMCCAGEVLLGTARSAPQLSLGLALDATAITVGSTAMLTSRMRLVPREMLGRMTGAFGIVILGSQTVGTLAGGLFAKIDLRAPYLICAGALLVLIVAVYPRLNLLDAVPEAAASIPAPAAPAEDVPAAGSAAGPVEPVNGSGPGPANGTANGSASAEVSRRGQTPENAGTG